MVIQTLPRIRASEVSRHRKKSHEKTFPLLFLLVFSMQCLGENLRTEEVEFVSHGATLSGSIVIPAGDIHAAVVFIHGSGKQTRNLGVAE